MNNEICKVCHTQVHDGVCKCVIDLDIKLLNQLSPNNPIRIEIEKVLSSAKDELEDELRKLGEQS